MPDMPEKPKTKTLAELIAEQTAKKANTPQPNLFPVKSHLPILSQTTKKQIAPAKPELKVAGFSAKKLEKVEQQFEKRNTNVTIAKPISPETALKHIPNATGNAPELTNRVIDLGINQQELEYDQSQEDALSGMIRYQFACMVGEAGTGKTTVTKKFVQRLMSSVPTIDLRTAWAGYKADNPEDDKPIWNVAIAFCAFTGRAVEQMKSKLPNEYWPLCNTIHATLGYRPVSEEYGYDAELGKTNKKIVFKPFFTSDNKLPYKIVIVDEAGMVPIPLWNELIAALPDDCRIYLIGDISQLPPVQGRSVLGFAMINWPTFALNKIHRQAADNPIIANAHRVLKGLYPKADTARFPLISIPDGSEGAFQYIIATIQKLHKAGVFDPRKDALIVPTNVNNLGQQAINEKLLMYFNPERKENGVVVNQRFVITTGFTHVGYAVGDKIMLLQNDRKKGLNNGMIGWITEINLNPNFKEERADGLHLDYDALADLEQNFSLGDALKNNLDENDFFDNDEDENEEGGVSPASEEDENSLGQRQASHITTVSFDNGVVEQFKTAGDYKKLMHAYAFTCHKSQGGEYPNVVIVCHGSQSRMMNREWLYTAITRARERVILLHNDRGLAKALKNQKIKGNSVQEKAESFMKWQEESLQGKDVSVPNLPISRELEGE